MPNLSIKNVPAEVVTSLRERASANHRSLQGELLALMSEAAAGQYIRYPPLVVDCSVLATVLFDEPDREAALLAMAGKELFAPDLLDHEIGANTP